MVETQGTVLLRERLAPDVVECQVPYTSGRRHRGERLAGVDLTGWRDGLDSGRAHIALRLSRRPYSPLRFLPTASPTRPKARSRAASRAHAFARRRRRASHNTVNTRLTPRTAKPPLERTGTRRPGRILKATWVAHEVT